MPDLHRCVSCGHGLTFDGYRWLGHGQGCPSLVPPALTKSGKHWPSVTASGEFEAWLPNADNETLSANRRGLAGEG